MDPSSIDWDPAGRGPPVDYLRRLELLLQRRAQLIASGYEHGPKIDRVERFIHNAKCVFIAANMGNPNPPF